MRFYRNACGRKIFVTAQFVGMGGFVYKGHEIVASEYQWVITRPDGYTYVMNRKPFREIYHPVDVDTTEYVKEPWVIGPQ